MAIDYVGVDIHVDLVILGQTVLEILEELISCRTNERTNMTKPIPIARKAFKAFRLKVSSLNAAT